MTEPARLCGRYIHQAADAIRTLRDSALDKAGIPFTQWQVLDKAPGSSRDDLIHRLAESPVDDHAGIARAIEQLREQELLSVDDQGNLALTTRGRVLRERVGGIRADLQTQLYQGISADDLGITQRVLAQLVERAKAVPAYSVHRPGSLSPKDWDDSYARSPHWDLGRPQPAFRALADAGAIRGRVLDVGCGTGEHVLMAAALGCDATGVDVAPAALHAARAKASDRDIPARFLLHDARKLADLGESFDTVLDCGLFHIFGDEDRAAHVDSVRSVLVPDGRYFMLCFSDRQPGAGGPRRVTREEITTTFADGWRIDSIEPATLDSPTGPGGIHAWLVALTRT